MILIVVASFAQLAIGLIGYFVRVFPNHSQRHRPMYLMSFVVISVLVCGLAILGAYRQELRQGRLLDSVTGGASFPVLIPQPSDDEKVHLAAWNHGDNPLNEVRVTSRCSIFPVSGAENIGTLAPGAHTSLLLTLDSNERCAGADLAQPVKGATVATWMFEMNTQNGVYSEMLQFKWMPTCRRWSYRFTVDSEGTVQFDERKTPRPTKQSVRLYDSGASRWVGAENCSPPGIVTRK
jgi:hypothetical protein